MGDAADDAIDRGMDEWMSGEYDEDWVPLQKSCRHCHASGLQWGKDGGEWRLFDSAGAVHVCSAKDVFK